METMTIQVREQYIVEGFEATEIREKDPSLAAIGVLVCLLISGKGRMTLGKLIADEPTDVNGNSIPEAGVIAAVDELKTIGYIY